MHLPPAFLKSLSGIEGFDAASFEAVHQVVNPVTSIRMNPAKITGPSVLSFAQIPVEQVPWCSTGYYLDQRPSFTFDPLLHAGCYYVQEASSMFIEQALRQTVDLTRDIKVLDLCAAPGGKSTHLQSLITEGSLLVSNEVIPTRTNILTDNIMRWGATNVMITRNDAASFQKLPGYFDVILVDAPCSGSGLFRRDEDAINEWSPGNVQLCSQRQQKILADVLPALKPGGILVYATCSFSREEDEDITGWLHKEFLLESLPLQISQDWNIVTTGKGTHNYGYRFFPDKLKGEGFFLSCLRKSGGTGFTPPKKSQKQAEASKKELAIIQNWVAPGSFIFYPFYDKIIAWPAALSNDFDLLTRILNVKYAGIMLGEIIRDKMIPHHALALSDQVAPSVRKLSLDHANAIKYLQRKELDAGVQHPGWHLVTFNNHALGWVNVLPNRINNYYPKELRILKES